MATIKFKKLFSIFIASQLIFVNNSFTQPESVDNYDFGEFSDVIQEALSESNNDSKSDQSDSEYTKDVAPAKESIADLAVSFVRSPIWIGTFPVRTRNPLYLIPLNRRIVEQERGFYLIPFFNKTRQVLTPLNSHLRFDIDDTIIDPLLEEALLKSGFNADEILSTQDFLRLFANFDIEERKGGVIFQYNIPCNDLYFQIDTSLLFVERNIITDKQTETQLRNIFTRLLGDTKIDFDEKRELARLRAGIGDTRFRLGFKAVNDPNLRIDLGLSAILPIASGVLLDGKFKKAHEPSISIFVDPFLKTVQKMLLESEQGSNGHYGAGVYFKCSVPLLPDRLALHAHASYDAYASSRISLKHIYTLKQSRYFMFKQTLTREDASKSDLAGEDGEQILNDFSQQYLIPERFKVAISPGDIFQATIILDGRINRWALRGGYDFYLQQREIFEKLYSSSTNVSLLKTSQGMSPALQQHKLMFEVGYNARFNDAGLKVALGGDYSIFSSGSGRDWTLYGSIGSSF